MALNLQSASLSFSRASPKTLPRVEMLIQHGTVAQGCGNTSTQPMRNGGGSIGSRWRPGCHTGQFRSCKSALSCLTKQMARDVLHLVQAFMLRDLQTKPRQCIVRGNSDVRRGVCSWYDSLLPRELTECPYEGSTDDVTSLRYAENPLGKQLCVDLPSAGRTWSLYSMVLQLAPASRSSRLSAARAPKSSFFEQVLDRLAILHQIQIHRQARATRRKLDDHPEIESGVLHTNGIVGSRIIASAIAAANGLLHNFISRPAQRPSHRLRADPSSRARSSRSKTRASPPIHRLHLLEPARLASVHRRG